MSGRHSRSAAASRAARLERVRPQQPAELRAGARHRPVAGLDRHHVGHERRQPLPQRAAVRPAVVGSSRQRAAARRRPRPASRASASGGSGAVPSGRRMPPPYGRVGRVERVAPALLRQRRPRARPVADEAAAAVERPRPASRPPSALGSSKPADRDREHDEPRRRVGGAVVGERARRPATRHRGTAAARASRNSCPILPGSSSVPGCERRPCRAASARSVAARHLGPRRQQLERRDQRVAPEQRVEAPGVALLDRRRRRVQEALVREQVIDRHRARTPCHGASVPSNSAPSRARSVAISTVPSSSTVTGASDRLSATQVRSPRRHAHAPAGAGSVS